MVKKKDIKIRYQGDGWYIIFSDSGNTYYSYPRGAYCTCPSRKRMCRHLKELYTRSKDDFKGIENVN